jgi:hypothetical protein
MYKYPAWERKAVKDKWRRMGERSTVHKGYLMNLRNDYEARSWSDDKLKMECLAFLNGMILSYMKLEAGFKWMNENLSGG